MDILIDAYPHSNCKHFEISLTLAENAMYET